MKLDTVIFGGGVAGLWLLDVLSRRGQHVVLLEAHELGSGQTIASQGILHGGLKYTLQGILTRSASQIREMPNVWRKALAGSPGLPSLKKTVVRSEFCHLWHTQSLVSRAGMLGARVGLSVTPEKLSPQERPECLANVPGGVAKLGEQVLSPFSLITDLFEQYRDRVLKFDLNSLEFDLDSPGEVRSIRLSDEQSGGQLVLKPHHVVLTAGAGNAELRARAGLSTAAMQRRPLHMVLARGDLPELNGHCVDGSRTRVTITSDVTSHGQHIWQIGGQVAEDGVAMEPHDLIAHVQKEVAAVLPGVSLDRTEWATYRIDRAEGAVSGGTRPENVQLLFAGNVTTGWPTKLVLAPVLAEELSQAIRSQEPEFRFDPLPLAHWKRPVVAQPLWETITDWIGYPASAPVRHVA
ncbi:MAG: FAD-dependent oxidoreductase [Planctomyces sp.]|nr:FAD-dependent oxidoreductase [Planctomyces sp.]